MVYAYIRVSTDKQDCENQKIGIEKKARQLEITIDKYIEDAGVSGIKEPEKRALGGCLRRLHYGDIIICSEISRLGRQLFMIMRILERCMKVGAKLYTVKEGYELGDNIQAKVLAFAFGLSSEIERDLISQRTKEALARRKAEGKRLGRPLGTKNAIFRLENKEDFIINAIKIGINRNYIAKKLHVSGMTLRHYIKSKNLDISTNK